MATHLETKLAERLAATERSLLDYQHRLREVENGRTFRGLSWLRLLIVNPRKAPQLVRDLPKLMKRVSVPPLPAKMPVAADYINESSLSGLPASLTSPPATLRYPHFKAAVIGEVGWLHSVCHAFALDKAEWQELFRFGIDMLVLNKPSGFSAKERDGFIKQFRAAEIPVIYFVHEAAELEDENLLKNIDWIVLRDSALESAAAKTGAQVLVLPPSVDPSRFNPIDWHRKATKGLLSVESPADEAVCTEAKEHRAVACEANKFASPAAYVETMLRLIASGTPVLASGHAELKKLLDYPTTKDNDARLQELANIYEREKASILWRRTVLDEHSDLRRFETLLTAVGLPTRERETISIIMSTRRPDKLEAAVKQIAAQNYPHKELILILHGGDFDTKVVDKLLESLKFTAKVLVRPDDTYFGENLNLALDAATGELVTKMDDDDLYGPNHLLDIYVALQYSGADLAGKWGNFVHIEATDQLIDFVPQREEHFGHHLPGATFIAKRDLLLRMRFGRVKRGIDSELHRRLEMRGGRLYSTHRYNFVRIRHDDHTYVKEAEDFIAHSDGEPRKGLKTEDVFV